MVVQTQTLVGTESSARTPFAFVVDFDHVVSRFYRAVAEHGSPVEVRTYGFSRQVNGSVLRSVLLWVSSLSEYGRYPVYLVRSSNTTHRIRKDYFAHSELVNSGDRSYAGGKVPFMPPLQDVYDAAVSLLSEAGVSVRCEDGFSSLDLLPTTVAQAHANHPGAHICVVSGSIWALSLIDGRTSVYRYPARMESSVDGFPLIKGYQQVTPDNFTDVLDATTLIKGVSVPYNHLWLARLTRGDKAVNLHIHPAFKGKPKKFNELCNYLDANGLHDLFQPIPWSLRYRHKPTGSVVDELPIGAILSEWSSIPTPPFGNYDALRVPLLDFGLSESDADCLISRHIGLSLGGCVISKLGGKSHALRAPALIPIGVSMLDYPRLQALAGLTGIQLPQMA